MAPTPAPATGISTPGASASALPSGGGEIWETNNNQENNTGDTKTGQAPRRKRKLVPD